jgi:hypothetical protein
VPTTTRWSTRPLLRPGCVPRSDVPLFGSASPGSRTPTASSHPPSTAPALHQCAVIWCGQMTSRRIPRRWATAVLLVAIVAAGCGGATNAASKAAVIESGQIPRADIPAGGTHGGAAGLTGNTIPLAKQNPTTALFSSLGVFQSCLTSLGVTFIGAPNPKDPSSGANNPAYIKNLVTCATRSDILQALKAAQSAQDNLTQSQIKTENKDYLKWRTCMVARGWGIPQPRPNSKGLLFSFGATGGTAQFKAPPGQSLLSSTDVQDCAAKAEQGGS